MKRIPRALLAATMLLSTVVSARAEPGEHINHHNEAPAPSAPAGRPSSFFMQPNPRTLDVPRRLADIRRDLKVGAAWVALTAEKPTALKASLEINGKVVAALTLDPNNGKPVPFLERSNYRPSALPSEVALGTYLTDLRKEATDLKFGAYLLPSPRGLEVQVYWSGKLVSYLYVNPNNGDVVADESTTREISNSPLRVK